MGTFTDSGYKKENLEEWISKVEDLERTICGDDIDLSETGPYGEFVQVLSQLSSSFDNVIEAVYWSRDIDNSGGLSLTKLCAETGTYRDGKTPTVVEGVLLLGDEGTIVPADTGIRQPAEYRDTEADDLIYVAQSDVAISRNNARYISLEVSDFSSGDIISISYDSFTYSYTAGSSDSKSDIAQAIADQSFAIGKDGDGIYILLETTTSFTFSGFTQLSVGTPAGFRASINGVYDCPANTLIEIVNPISGWLSVYNPSAGVVGTKIESDPALRIRQATNLIGGKATELAIQREVGEVSDVSLAICESNREDIEVDGRPPHSTEVIVSGGDNDDIAQAIYDSVGAGIQYFGRNGVSGTAIDEDDAEITIYFTRPEPVYIWIRFTRSSNSEQSLPVAYASDIKLATKTYNDNRYSLGDNIIRNEQASPFYQTTGSILELIEIAKTDLPTDTPIWTEDNIVDIAGFEFGYFDESRILVVDL